AKSANDAVSVRRTIRQGLWVTIVVSALMTPVIWHFEAIFLLLGQEPEIAELAQTYSRTSVWMLVPFFGFIVLRGLITAHDDTSVLMPIIILGIITNALINYALMFGNWSFPRLELAGAGIATALVNALMFIALFAYTLLRQAYRQYSLLIRFWKPDWQRFGQIFRVGLPIGLMMLSEVGLFSIAGFFMGWLGTDELAAHGVALQLAAITFMIPLGLSHAATVRVALARGRRSSGDIRRAGWVAIAMGTGFMGLSAIVFWLAPETLIGFFLDSARPENHAAISLAVSYLAIAALFQIFDGAQVVSSSVLRGLNDTMTPMIIGIAGYWGVGLSLAYGLAFVFDLRGVGVWVGLAAGLASAALIFSLRFAWREKVGIV
ncbi:MAG: MATE family efflux transporter, partial [Hyphomicrobiales bacterium]|nr:MATE family efflux transporter [Hyphomicrobiales bacterium]